MAERSPKTLIVDDEMDTRLIIASVLELLAYDDFAEARDGEEALAMLRADAYGLVISDWVMPKVSGLELLETMRADRKLKRIPFIMVTAEGEERHIVRAMDAGATDFLIKPFETRDLEERVAKALGR